MYKTKTMSSTNQIKKGGMELVLPKMKQKLNVQKKKENSKEEDDYKFVLERTRDEREERALPNKEM